MKLRYYLRGLGIGILVTALIMGVATEEGRPLTDAEVRAQALAMGMVDPGSLQLKDLEGMAARQSASPAPEGTESPAADGTESPAPEGAESPKPGENTESPKPEETQNPVSEETESPKPERTQSPASEATQSPVPEAAQSPKPEATDSPAAVTLSVVRGDNSYTVSRRLKEAGLIEDAEAFDTYLVEEGYSTTIRTGTYQIPVGATWEEIAEIIA